MSFKDIFLIFSKVSYEEVLEKKISALEMNIENLKKSIDIIQNKEQQPVPEQKEPPIIIERINIEKIVLDKYELNNNFGQLGIKELKGKLNIGATYGSEFIPRTDEKEKNTNRPSSNIRKQKEETGPKVNIKTKSEK